MPKKHSLSHALAAAALVAAGAASLPAAAQNLAVVNGKPVPKARLEMLLDQAKRSGQQLGPDIESRARDEVVRREIFAQEAERRGVARSPTYQQQMELARQSILIRELFEDQRKKQPVTDAEIKAEYDKLKSQNAGTEYRARHILVETEAEAKELIAQIKGGAKFEDLAKTKSKDPGSGQNGGDLDFARSDAYVPEFGKAMAALSKGQMTEAPVKSQFGWHVIRLEDTRTAQFPELDAVKPQIEQHLGQQRLLKFQEDLVKGAKTDYKFGS